MHDITTGRNQIYCVGNGKVAAYLKGAEIWQIFAPYYSLPSVFSLFLENRQIECKTKRLSKSATRCTHLFLDGKSLGSVCDFTHCDKAIYYRENNFEEEIAFTFESEFVKDETSEYIEFYMPTGTNIYSLCNTDKEVFCRLYFSNGIVYKNGKLIFPKGKSYIVFEGRNSAFLNTEKIQVENISKILADVNEKWKKFIESAKDCVSAIPDNYTLKEQVALAVEDTLINMKTQTAQDGGVLAGFSYHLAYGRDMFGVIKTYVLLGLYEQAKKCIQFRIDNYRLKGRVPNANGMGMNCSHNHENDLVEQTGYFLLELFEYCKKSGDWQFLYDNKDYALWAVDAQIKNVHNEMLPFNGDETYVARSLLPRTCLDHGALEATLLFIEGSQKVLGALLKGGKISQSEYEEKIKTVNECKENFSFNFIKDGEYITNNPERLKKLTFVPKRHGVCVGCFAFGWMEKLETGIYLCPNCISSKVNIAISDKIYKLDCVTHMLPYIQSDLIDKKVLEKTFEKEYRFFIENGRRESEGEFNEVVGYEYGLFINTMAMLGVEDKNNAVMQKLLSLKLESGAWIEYYKNGQAIDNCCPYRPWESAMNLYGILNYLNFKFKIF